MTAKNIQLKIVPLTCDFCMKYTICENYSAEKLNDKKADSHLPFITSSGTRVYWADTYKTLTLA